MEQLLLSSVLCPALQSLTQTSFWEKIEGTREIRGLYVLILVQILLNALASFKKIPLGIFSLFLTLMGHIILDHPLMFCFVGWGFFKEGIKSDLS